MTPFLLTIAIPTYNRAPLLDTALASLAERLRSVTFPVEVIVVNNRSTDATASICRKHAGSLPNFRYVENNENIGAELNIVRCSILAQGEFVYVRGDDDDIGDGIFDAFLKCQVANDDVDIFIMNYTQASRDMSTIVCDNMMEASEDIKFDRLRDFLKRPASWDCVNFISAVIFRREPFLATDYDYYNGFASHFGYWASLLEAFTDRPAYLIAQPYVTQRQFNQRMDETKPEEATIISNFAAYLGIIRLVGAIVDKGVLSMGEIEAITAKTSVGAVGTVQIVPMLEWCAWFLLKQALLRHPDKFTKAIYDESRAFTQRIESSSLRNRILMLNDMGYNVATTRWQLAHW